MTSRGPLGPWTGTKRKKGPDGPMADQPWQWATLPTGTTFSALGRPPKAPLADPKQQARREAASSKKQRQRAAAKEKEKQRMLSHLSTDTFQRALSRERGVASVPRHDLREELS